MRVRCDVRRLDNNWACDAEATYTHGPTSNTGLSATFVAKRFRLDPICFPGRDVVKPVLWFNSPNPPKCPRHDPPRRLWQCGVCSPYARPNAHDIPGLCDVTPAGHAQLLSTLRFVYNPLANQWKASISRHFFLGVNPGVDLYAFVIMIFFVSACLNTSQVMM